MEDLKTDYCPCKWCKAEGTRGELCVCITTPPRKCWSCNLVYQPPSGFGSHTKSPTEYAYCPDCIDDKNVVKFDVDEKEVRWRYCVCFTCIPVQRG